MRRVAVVAVSLGLLLAGCRQQGLSRDELERRYVDGLIEGGVDEDVAECVIARFFAALDDDELEEFNTSGTGLTGSQLDEVARLTASCTSV